MPFSYKYNYCQFQFIIFFLFTYLCFACSNFRDANMLKNNYQLQDSESENNNISDSNIDEEEKENFNSHVKYGCNHCKIENSEYIHSLLKLNAVYDDELNRSLKKYIDYPIYSESEVIQLVNKIIYLRKEAFIKFLDCNIYLNGKTDLKRIIFEYTFLPKLNNILKGNKVYKKFFLKKINKLEYNSIKQIVKEIENHYVNTSYEDFFDLHYHELLEKVYSYENDFFRIKERIKFKLLRLEKYRNNFLTKKKISTNCFTIKLFPVLRFLGLVLLLIYITSLILICLEVKNYPILVIFIIGILLGSPWIIPKIFSILDPGLKDTKNLYSKCRSKTCPPRTFKEKQQEILDISNKKSCLDILFCREYEELYPGLKKPHWICKCFKFNLKNICKPIICCCNYCCKHLSVICEYSKYCTSKISKLIDFKIINEEQLLHSIEYNNNEKEEDDICCDYEIKEI